ncbi:MAG: M15 family metallopeptidase [Actinomycetota bacterium]|nr:M15 family metallopeptidase [Actinomycetota bacterium]
MSGVTSASAISAMALLLALAPPAMGLQEAEETITVFQPGGLSEELEATTRAISSRAGARMAVFHAGTLRLVAVRRGAQVVQEAPQGFAYPMSTMAVEPQGAAPLLGGEVADVLGRGELVLGRVSASLRLAEVGDRVELVGWDGKLHRLPVGAVVDDAQIGWSEMALSEERAASLGLVRPSYAVLWDFSDPRKLKRALERDAPEGAGLAVRWSSDPPRPDRTLPSALLKQRFGEFAYRPTGEGDQVEIEPDWVEGNIVWVELPGLGRFRCHRSLVAYLEGVMGELWQSGQILRIDQHDFQHSGGCYNPRQMRGGDKGGALSRHAWGVAIDINPSRNPYGGPGGDEPGGGGGLSPVGLRLGRGMDLSGRRALRVGPLAGSPGAAGGRL